MTSNLFTASMKQHVEPLNVVFINAISCEQELDACLTHECVYPSVVVASAKITQ